MDKVDLAQLLSKQKTARSLVRAAAVATAAAVAAAAGQPRGRVILTHGMAKEASLALAAKAETGPKAQY